MATEDLVMVLVLALFLLFSLLVLICYGYDR